jgi:beta-N-acetylhexosaminidase
MRRAIERELRQQLGQFFWIGFSGTTFTRPLASLLRRIRPGGIILFGRNIQSAAQVRSLTDAIYGSASIPPFIAIDQEGGRVNRLRAIVGPSLSNHALARCREPAAAVRLHARATSLALRSLGFNVNFTPVLDLSGPRQRNGIGDRAFGTDPLIVTGHARRVVRAHLAAGIIPVGKHFPGLGEARQDTHTALPVIRRSRRGLVGREIEPYRRLRAALPMIMVGHGCYPALQGDPAGPASLSHAVVSGCLRHQLGYGGLILTDDLEMGAIGDDTAVGDRVREAFAAGHDGLMFCQSEERIVAALEALIEGLHLGEFDAGEARRRLLRIARLKERFLLRVRRPRYSAAALARARAMFASMDPAAQSGFDPTARA